MNIFLFSPLDLEAQAKYHPDKLVVKIPLECSQMLNNNLMEKYKTSIPKLSEGFYKPTHIHHPCSKWMGLSNVNLSYGVKYLKSLILEYEKRYKKTSNYRYILDFVIKTISIDYTGKLPHSFVIAINDNILSQMEKDNVIPHIHNKLDVNPLVASIVYRNYLLYAKCHYAEWRYSTPPYFWKHEYLSKYNGRFCKI